MTSPRYPAQRRLLSHPTIPVPSQRWSAWTKVDDPDYKRKLAAYHKNKKPLWERLDSFCFLSLHHAPSCAGLGMSAHSSQSVCSGAHFLPRTICRILPDAMIQDEHGHH